MSFCYLEKAFQGFLILYMIMSKLLGKAHMLLWVLDPAFSGQLHSRLFSISIPPMPWSDIHSCAPRAMCPFCFSDSSQAPLFPVVSGSPALSKPQHLTNAYWTVQSLESEFRESRQKKKKIGGWDQRMEGGDRGNARMNHRVSEEICHRLLQSHA